METIKALMVEPGKAPYEVDIPNTLEAFQKAVDGYIELVALSDTDPVVGICNEEGKINDLPLNRAIFADVKNPSKGIREIIAGNFLVVGTSGSEFSDISPKLMEKYRDIYRYPEKFMETGRGILVVKLVSEPNKTKSLDEDIEL